jgi:hypothetical protein
MPIWVMLKPGCRTFYDGVLDWGLKRNEIKRLPEPLPTGSLTSERFRLGGFVVCAQPRDEIGQDIVGAGHVPPDVTADKPEDEETAAAERSVGLLEETARWFSENITATEARKRLTALGIRWGGREGFQKLCMKLAKARHGAL